MVLRSHSLLNTQHLTFPEGIPPENSGIPYLKKQEGLPEKPGTAYLKIQVSDT
jgi:hypothetical protein